MMVNEIMTTNPVTVSLDDRLSVVKRIFEEKKFHHLLVVDDGELIGVVSDRDMLRAVSSNIGTSRYVANDMASLDKPVHQIVSRQPVTLLSGALLDDAMVIFNTHRISCIPIVDANFAPVGILTWRDIIANFPRICAAAVEAEIARRDALIAAAVSAAEANEASDKPPPAAPAT
jgi:acetoin utilization protein AcuB